MSVIFDNQPGRLVTLPSSTPKAFRLSVDDLDLPGIATQVSWTSTVSSQILTSLANTVHVVSFGDRPGTLTVSVILNQSCDQTGSTNLDDFLNFYFYNRLSAYGGRIDPMRVIVGNQAYWGYLTGNQGVAQSEGSQLITGTLAFVAWQI